MKKKWLDAYMDVASRFADLSSARRLKVGSIIVKDQRIISIGINGTPSGWDNNCETESNTTKPEVIHAELNCLYKLAKSSESGEGAIMFITHAPCIECAKGIYSSGISAVYYKHSYKNDSGLVFLEKCKIPVIKL